MGAGRGRDPKDLEETESQTGDGTGSGSWSSWAEGEPISGMDLAGLSSVWEGTACLPLRRSGRAQGGGRAANPGSGEKSELDVWIWG